MKYSTKQEIYKDYESGSLTIYEVIKHFDDLTSAKNKEGVVYTPGYIADAMVEKVKPTPDQKTIEFCVGHGVFVFALLLYFKKNKVSKDQVVSFLKNNLFAHDISEDSIVEFKEILSIFMKKEFGITSFEVPNVFAKNSLEYIKGKHSFDLSLGNPPYIRFQNLQKKDRTFLQKNFKSCKSGNVDIYFAFLELASKISKKSIHIVPNSFLKNKSAQNLRHTLKDTISYLKDFKSFQVFSTVGVYAAIIGTDQNPENKTFEFEFDKSKETIEKSFLTKEDWNLENIALLKTIGSKAHKMLNKADFFSGLATLADGVFILKQPLKDGFVKITVDEKEFSIEEGILKKYLKVSKVKSKQDLKKFTYQIIYPYDSDGKIIDEAKFKKDFPGAYAYLSHFKTKLNNRDKGKVENYDAWYAYGRRQGFPAKYKGSVVVIPGMISKSSNYITLENSEDYLFGSGYLLAPKKGFALKDLIKVLSEPAFLSYVSVTGKVWKGKEGHDYYSPNKKVILNYAFDL